MDVSVFDGASVHLEVASYGGEILEPLPGTHAVDCKRGEVCHRNDPVVVNQEASAWWCHSKDAV